MGSFVLHIRLQKGSCRMSSRMTAKQKLFCDEYLIDLNATRAAIRAGYSEKTAGVIGVENLKKPNIKEYIDKRLEELESEKIADVKEVMEYFTSVMRGKSRSEIVVVEGIGDGMSEARKITKAPDERERLKAAELLGKRYGLFTDKNSSMPKSKGVTIINDAPGSKNI